MADENNQTQTIKAIPDLKYWCKGEPSEVGKRVAFMLSEWAGGAHHLPMDVMEKIDWTHTRFITFDADASLGGSFSTYDFDGLTALVFLAHDHCIRVEIQPARGAKLKLLFHPRSRTGDMSLRHPTIEHALKSWRETNQPVVREAQPEPVTA